VQFILGHPIYIAVTRLSQCVADVAKWLSASRLRLNPDKTVTMWLGSRHQVDVDKVTRAGFKGGGKLGSCRKHRNTSLLTFKSGIWSCRFDARKALVQGCAPISQALANIERDEDEMPNVRSEAKGLHERMYKLETGIYAVFWNDILGRVNATNNTLQDPKLDLNTAVALLKSLKSFVSEKRECFHVYEEKGKEISGTEDYYYMQMRSRQRNVGLRQAQSSGLWTT